MVAPVKRLGNVMFLESVPPDYPAALARQQYLQRPMLGSPDAVVIYRHSVDGDRSYLSRQIDPAQGFPTSDPPPPNPGEQCYADETNAAITVGYDLFVVPVILLSADDPPSERALTLEILELLEDGQLPPTNGGPKGP
ncbi:MAG TPA: hypothetical protein VK540_22925 [Polyangiaceae bacterium]|nr:hypothetical protein [Polyangiaceae bacterium]